QYRFAPCGKLQGNNADAFRAVRPSFQPYDSGIPAALGIRRRARNSPPRRARTAAQGKKRSAVLLEEAGAEGVQVHVDAVQAVIELLLDPHAHGAGRVPAAVLYWGWRQVIRGPVGVVEVAHIGFPMRMQGFRDQNEASG